MTTMGPQRTSTNATRWAARWTVGVLAAVMSFEGSAWRSGSDSAAGEAAPEPAAQALTALATDLYRVLGAREGNLFFSPTSIATCLAMVWAGARGDTADQMARALHFDLTPDAQHTALGQWLARMNRLVAPAGARLTLTIANAIWPQRGADLLPAYRDLLERHYRAAPQPVDYVAAAEQARQTINRWVEEHTGGKIAELIPAGGVDARTRLVLTNAVYFYGAWRLPFDKEQTRPEPFAVAPGRTVQAPLMRASDKRLPYAERDGVQAVRLDYAGGTLGMLVLLPRGPQEMAALERGLDAAALARWRAELREVELDVYLPRFRLETSFQLSKALIALGMRDAFDPARADFSGINGRRDLFVDEVYHKAYVDVTEEGTEAAAATGAVMRLTMAVQKPVFRADRPFVFVIQDNRDGAILFMGRVADPTAGGGA